MYPKKFSDYTPITDIDGEEIVPIVKNGANATVQIKSLPVPADVQTEIDAKADEADLQAHVSDTNNPHAVTKTQVGLGNVDNTSDLSKPISTATQTALTAKAATTYVDTQNALNEKLANKNVANGYPGLDGTGKVAAAQLPSYVDDVLEFANLAAFPATGSTGIIYVADDTGLIYRWSGSAYVNISTSPGDATTSAKGIVQLAGDLGGTATSPTVPGLANKANTSSLAPVATSGAYADLTGKPTIPTVSDATTSSKGIVQLAGDLAGTAAAPTVINRLRVYNSKDYGAVGDGITNDTAALQSALNAANAAGGGHVYFNKGTYLINAPLKIYSNTKLELALAATVSLASGANCNMIQNAGVTANRSVSDAVTTLSSTTVSSATAAFTSADIGSSIIIPGAGVSGQLYVATILSITSSTAVVTNLAAGTAVSAAAISIYRHDTNIEICGGTWNRNANSGTNSGLHSIFLRHLDTVFIHDFIGLSTAGKYMVALGDVTDYTVDNLRFVTISDGVHVTGPAIGGTITNMYGTTQDDMIGITAGDYTTYADTAGTIDGLLVDNVYGVNALCLLKIVGGTGVQVNRITGRALHGTVSQAVCRIFDDQTGSTNCLGILIEDVDAMPGSGYQLVCISCSAGNDITLRNLVMTQGGSGSEAVKVTSPTPSGTALIDSLLIDGVRVLASTSTTNNTIDLGNGQVNKLVVNNVFISSAVTNMNAIIYIGIICPSISISNVHATFPAGGNAVARHSSGTTVCKVRMSNIYLTGGGRFYRNDMTSLNDIVQISNSTLDNAWDLMQATGPVDLTLIGCIINVQQTYLVLINNAAGTVVLRGMALAVTSSSVGFNISGSPAAPRVINSEFPVDLSTVAKNNGDEAYNTNGALACGVGKAISNGTNWKNIYSGSVY